MHQFQCRYAACGKIFESVKKFPKFCSFTCRSLHRGWDPRICIICKSEFFTKHSTQTCSRKCKITVQSFLTVRPCLFCKTLFQPAQASRQFCSKRCGNLAARKLPDRICKFCKATFRSKDDNVKFCGRPCFYLFRSGGVEASYPRKGLIFTVLMRRQIRERDGEFCIECGCVERLEYDHILALALGGANHPENGQILCYRCHKNKTREDTRAWHRLKKLENLSKAA